MVYSETFISSCGKTRIPWYFRYPEMLSRQRLLMANAVGLGALSWSFAISPYIQECAVQGNEASSHGVTNKIQQVECVWNLLSQHLVERRPIDPPPIIQLKIIDKGHPELPVMDIIHEISPYIFVAAVLVPADTRSDTIVDPLHTDTHWRHLTGRTVSSLHILRDLDDEESAFFVFPDMYVREDGIYRLKMYLFEVQYQSVYYRQSVLTQPFVVYSGKRFPGMHLSSALACRFAEQGLKIRIRKGSRKRPKKIRRVSRDDREESFYNDKEDDGESVSGDDAIGSSASTESRHDHKENSSDDSMQSMISTFNRSVQSVLSNRSKDIKPPVFDGLRDSASEDAVLYGNGTGAVIQRLNNSPQQLPPLRLNGDDHYLSKRRSDSSRVIYTQRVHLYENDYLEAQDTQTWEELPQSLGNNSPPILRYDTRPTDHWIACHPQCYLAMQQQRTGVVLPSLREHFGKVGALLPLHRNDNDATVAGDDGQD